MDFDFALVLFIAVVVTGGIWLLDILFLKKNRESGSKEEPQQQPLIVEYAVSFFPVLLVVFLIRSFLFEPFQIPSKSMVPTLEVGDFILVNKFTYGIRLPVIGNKVIGVNEPDRGEVMVFIPPHDDRYFIKRVIGLPGDYIRMQDNQLWVNNEPYVQEFVETVSEKMTATTQLSFETTGNVTHEIHVQNPAGRYGRGFEYVVPDDHYFMMGDNRDNSLDSRSWGPVPESNIVGKAIAIWMHWEGWGIPSFSRVGGIE